MGKEGVCKIRPFCLGKPIKELIFNRRVHPHSENFIKMEKNTELLDFHSFLKNYFPEYKIDADNDLTIKMLSMWSCRDKRFENKEKGYHLDKGIMLLGDIGTGKTDLFRILQVYLKRYLKSRYQFSYQVVWKFTSEFNKNGYDCFSDQEEGHRYYDELCLVDTRNKQPLKEMAMHFGSKLLVGEEIIMMRYNVLKSCGYQSHFSTNATPAQLAEVYGDRAYDRLTEMCNFLTLVGESRRGNGGPNIYRNINNPAPPPPREISEEEDSDNKKMLEAEYTEFLNSGIVSDMATIHYELLKIYKCDVGNDEQMRANMEMVSPGYSVGFLTLDKGKTAISDDKKAFVWKEAKKLAVTLFYQRLKEGGAKSIFGEVSISGLPEDYKK